MKDDAGPIIKYEKGIFPEYCKANRLQKLFSKEFLKFYSNFIIDLKSKKFLQKFQPDYLDFIFQN